MTLERLSLEKFQPFALSSESIQLAFRGGKMSMSSDNHGGSDEADLSDSDGNVIATSWEDVPRPGISGNKWDDITWTGPEH